MHIKNYIIRYYAIMLCSQGCKK